jgi:hypothetical protein
MSSADCGRPSGIPETNARVVPQRRAHHAGADRVDRHVAVRDLLGQGLGQADHAELGRAVVRQVRQALLARHGRDVDDPARPPLQHRRQHPLAHHQDPAQVDRHKPVPVRVRNFNERGDARHPGIVHQHIHRAELLLDARHRLVHRTPVGDVKADAEPACRRRAIRVQVADSHPGPGRGQDPRDPGPDPRGTPGDQRHLPVQRGAHDAARAGSTCRAISSSDAVAASTGRPGGRAQKTSSS